MIYGYEYIDADKFSDEEFDNACRRLWNLPENKNQDLFPLCTKFRDLAFNPPKKRYKIFLVKRLDYANIVTGYEPQHKDSL